MFSVRWNWMAAFDEGLIAAEDCRSVKLCLLINNPAKASG